MTLNLVQSGLKGGVCRWGGYGNGLGKRREGREGVGVRGSKETETTGLGRQLVGCGSKETWIRSGF